MQVKLLRVIQEREIERLGGNEVIKIDVRIIAATSRNLEKEVKNGNFRLDLYYRLCVYPIIIPPLRQRGSDILLLTDHFVQHFSAKFARTIIGLTSEAKKQLQTYPWPGNVRELENSLERSVLLCRSNQITQISIFTYDKEADEPAEKANNSPSLSIDDNAREHILSVIRKCNGKIGGQGGAAEQLGIPASTLHSKMKKLGLKKWI
jgi:transcriptional regulator with GAF, ATPase, and Fis domain